MIEMTELPGNRAVCVRQRGMQSAETFGALSNTLMQTPSQRRWRILFDWTELEGWDDRREFNLSCRKWSQTVDTIARASILHRPRWNRQAALLAAVFRMHGRPLTWRIVGKTLQMLRKERASRGRGPEFLRNEFAASISPFVALRVHVGE